MNKTLGVDIGNVIINNRNLDPEITQVDEVIYANFPPTEDVFDALKILNTKFSGKVYLISKCTEWAEIQILSWLDKHDFYNKTGILKENIFFVRKRNEKDGVCQKLNITHFIDDRLEVLSYMIESTPNLFLFQPDNDEVAQFAKFLPQVTIVNNWKEVVGKM